MSDQLPLLNTGELAAEDDPDLKSGYEKSEENLPTTKFSSLQAEDEHQFPLMKVPKEVRLNVYDCLFTDLTIVRQCEVANLTVYHPPHEWPGNDFSNYRNLLLTCKEVHDEAKSLWENMYIRHCVFYFWKPQDLYRVAKLLTDLGGPYQRMSYALRTRPESETGRRATDFIDDLLADLMYYQKGFPEDDTNYNGFHWAWPRLRWGEGPGTYTLLENGCVPYEIYVQDVGTCARTDFSGLTHCSISVHESLIGIYAQAQYLLMRGKVGGIVWDDYDPLVGHVKTMLWEEWVRRGYPSSCLDRSDIVLKWRAQAMSGRDETWLNLGGTPDDLSSMRCVQHEYGLSSWLMAERR